MADDDTQVEGQSLSAVIANELRNAEAFGRSDTNQRRSLAIQYMRGEMPDLPSAPGRSQATSRDVSDTLGWIVPGVVRVFLASDKMVVYTQTNDQDEQGAREATDYTNYSFKVENPGYKIVYDVTYDALQMANGVIACGWEAPKTETRTFRNLSMDEISVKVDEGWEVQSYKPGESLTDEDGTLTETLTLKMQRVIKPGRISDTACKPENLFLDTAAVSIDTARFVAYLFDDKTRSDLVEMADTYDWDKDVIENLPSFNRIMDNEVSQARQRDEFRPGSSPLKSNDPMDLYRVFMRADVDDDGIAELLEVWYVGRGGTGAVLGWSEWEDDVPYSDIRCYPIPHQYEAESVFDRTVDIQRQKTTLLRQMLDNLYAVGMPLLEVEEGSVSNPDMLVHRKFGGVLWRKKGSQATAPITPLLTPFIGDKLLVGMEYLDTQITRRTGVSNQTMALDPEALQNQTATASQNQRDAGYSQIELIARNMAEYGGWTEYFAKRLRLAAKYEQVRQIPSKQSIEINPQTGKPAGFAEINPQKWNPEMPVTIDVGLGTGSRDRDMAMLNSIKNGQLMMATMLTENGMAAKAIEFIPKIRKTAVQEAEASGIKNPESYYPEFTDDEVKAAIEKANQPPPPDPAIALEQMKGQTAMQLEQAKGQVATQNKQVDAQVDQHAAELKAQGEITKNQAELEADLTTKEADRQNALDIEKARIAGELEKQQRELDFKAWQVEFTTNASAQLEREKMASAAQIAESKPEPAEAGA